MELRNQNAVVYLHSSELMTEVENYSAKLEFCACTHLGGWATWKSYERLIASVIMGKSKLRSDGYLVVFQTDAYINARVMPRGSLLLAYLKGWGFELLDAKIWQRKKADFRQPPYTHVFVMAPPQGTARRPNPRNVPYFQGVWDYPQVARGKLNSWPDSLCSMMIETFTEPGDLILDPFCGSARLLGLASRLDRHAVGYEIDPTLVPLIAENLNMKEG